MFDASPTDDAYDGELAALKARYGKVGRQLTIEESLFGPEEGAEDEEEETRRLV